MDSERAAFTTAATGTLTLILDIFGGFTPAEWESRNRDEGNIFDGILLNGVVILEWS
jgi:hypothetical protein